MGMVKRCNLISYSLACSAYPKTRIICYDSQSYIPFKHNAHGRFPPPLQLVCCWCCCSRKTFLLSSHMRSPEDLCVHLRQSNIAKEDPRWSPFLVFCWVQPLLSLCIYLTEGWTKWKEASAQTRRERNEKVTATNETKTKQKTSELYNPQSNLI